MTICRAGAAVDRSRRSLLSNPNPACKRLDTKDMHRLYCTAELVCDSSRGRSKRKSWKEAKNITIKFNSSEITNNNSSTANTGNKPLIKNTYKYYSTIMRSSSLILLTALATSEAFAPNANLSTRNMNVNNGLHMTVKVPITLTGDNIDLTPALQEYANEKLERTLGKLSSVSGVTHCDVHLTVNKNPKVR